MLFVITWEVKPEHRDEVIARFKSIKQGAHEGINIVGTWHAVTQEEGWSVAEADDSIKLGKWLHEWTDLNVNHVTPVVDNAGMREIIK